MSDRPHPSDLDRLAGFAPAVRSVARAVVRDGHIAEDVVQDALLAAVERGSDTAREPKRWFTGVVRNLARRRVRTDAARGRREKAAARPEAEPSASEVVARTETHRRVVAAVLELPEPYRETLLLRYFDELAPREIAVRQGVPGGTVRSRLTRGVEMLRERFDADEGGDRRAWALAFVPLCAPSAGGGATGSSGTGPGAVASTAVGSGTAASVTGLGAFLMASKSNVVAITGLIALLLIMGAAVLVGMGDGVEEIPSIHVAAQSEEGTGRVHVEVETEPTEDGMVGVPEGADVVSPAVELHGLVLHASRRPAAGVRVRAAAEDGVGDETVTDERGRYILPGTPPAMSDGTSFVVLASDGAGNAATEVVYHRQAAPGVVRDVPTLVLQPAYSVAVRVTDEEGEPVAGARVSCREHDRIFMGQGETDARGRVRFDALPECEVYVRAYKEGVGRAVSLGVMSARPSAEVALRLTRRSVRVHVVDSSGNPVRGVRFVGRHHNHRTGSAHFDKYDPPVVTDPTDALGVTMVEDVGAEDWFSLSPLLPGVPAPRPYEEPTTTSGGADVRSGVTDVEVVLPDASRVRWPLEMATGVVPANGIRLVLERDPGSMWPGPHHRAASAWVEDGAVVADVDAWLEMFSARAVTSDGAWCILEGKAAGKPVSFQATRSVLLRVVEADGSPVAGMSLQAYGSHVRTDARGEARIDRLAMGPLEIGVSNGFFTGDFHRSESISQTVDVGADDTEVTVTLARVQDLVVNLLVDGKPGIPATLESITTGWGRPYAAIENAETGEIRLKLRRSLDNRLTVHARARGYQPASAAITVAEGDILPPVTLDLRTGATFRGHVIAADARFTELELQRWESAREKWERVPIHVVQRGYSTRLMVSSAGKVVAHGLRAGRYRLFAKQAGATSEPVELVPGVAASVCVLQVGPTVQVTGRIEFPDGVARDDDVRLVVEGSGFTRAGSVRNRNGGISLRPDGTFSATVPEGQEVSLRVFHPAYVADPDEGSVTVTGAESDLVLRLARGASTTFRLPSGVHEVGLRTELPVVFYAGDVEGRPDDIRLGEREGDRIVVAGHQSGTFNVWIDPMGDYAPVILEGVRLPPADGGEIDLPLSRGASIRVTIPNAETRQTAATAGVSLSATWLSPHGFKHSRTKRFVGQEALVLSGLLPGRYRVRIFVPGDAPLSAETDVTIEDGTGTLEIDLDPR